MRTKIDVCYDTHESYILISQIDEQGDRTAVVIEKNKIEQLKKAIKEMEDLNK
jgi:hypothetical protein